MEAGAGTSACPAGWGLSRPVACLLICVRFRLQSTMTASVSLREERKAGALSGGEVARGTAGLEGGEALAFGLPALRRTTEMWR